jgi:hypothetical protein
MSAQLAGAVVSPERSFPDTKKCLTLSWPHPQGADALDEFAEHPTGAFICAPMVKNVTFFRTKTYLFAN